MRVIVDVSDVAGRLVDEAIAYLEERHRDGEGCSATAETALRRVMLREAEARGAFLPTTDVLELLAAANKWEPDFRAWPLASGHQQSLGHLNNLKTYLASQLA